MRTVQAGRWMAGSTVAVVLACGAVLLAQGPQPAQGRPPQASLPPQHVPVVLWPNGAPGSEGKSGAETVVTMEDGQRRVATIHQPSITPYLAVPSRATGAAVIIAPGGGHRFLSIDMEGYDVAQWLSAHGVTAFVLKYRLAMEKGSTYTIEGDELADMQRALRTVRSRAAEWQIDPERIGVMGFSAGGMVAALASTRFDAGLTQGKDEIDRVGSKPAFQVLFYPNIPKEMQLSKETPAAFLLCGENDSAGIALELPKLHLALREAGASSELHVYSGVGHGFGLQLKNQGSVAEWPEMLLAWMDTKGFLKKS